MTEDKTKEPSPFSRKEDDGQKKDKERQSILGAVSFEDREIPEELQSVLRDIAREQQGFSKPSSATEKNSKKEEGAVVDALSTGNGEIRSDNAKPQTEQELAKARFLAALGEEKPEIRSQEREERSKEVAGLQEADRTDVTGSLDNYRRAMKAKSNSDIEEDEKAWDSAPLNLQRRSRKNLKTGFTKKRQQISKTSGRRKKLKIWLFSIASTLLLLLALGGVIVNADLQAVNRQNKVTKSLTVPASASSHEIAGLLKKNNLIKNDFIFEVYSRLTGNANFKSGTYSLSETMDVREIAATLNGKGTSTVLGKITIPEGYTIDQISKAITVNSSQSASNPQKTPFASADFLKVIKDQNFITQMQKKYPQLFATLPASDSGVKYQLEGYLFPATYTYDGTTSIKSLVEEMVASMDKNLQPYYSQLSGKNLSVNQLLSLAALVEKEANTQDERGNVAQVFFNRISSDMTLDSNVALLYAAGKLGTSVTVSEDANVDTASTSPYNLYKNKGTGPGPVDNPSLISIQAVLNPISNDYLYFLADPVSGQIYFAKTLEEQNDNVNKFINKQ